jgi:hypothetical protein
MIKPRIYKQQLRKVLTTISEKLWTKFQYRHLTPATLELYRRELAEIQQTQAEREHNDIWLIPIEIKIDQDNPLNTVLVPDLSAVIILDFDE